MRILAISDTESPALYEYFDAERFSNVDLVLSAGDLKATYLSFIATVLSVPVLYVLGNHDTQLVENPPGGCICIEDWVYVHKGIRIAGLGGSMVYSGAPLQYTESQMAWRIFKKSLHYRKGVDILLTHSPAYGLGDGTDTAHIGFKAFLRLMDKYEPQLMVHGHQHLNYGQNKRFHTHGKTRIVNAYGYTLIDL